MSRKVKLSCIDETVVSCYLKEVRKKAAGSLKNLIFKKIFQTMEDYLEFQALITKDNMLHRHICYDQLPAKFPSIATFYFVNDLPNKYGTDGDVDQAWIDPQSIGVVIDVDGEVSIREEAVRKFARLIDRNSNTEIENELIADMIKK
jgi:hypothetical protein